jgi:hypothetical protein|tara:strand:+ start:1194 stop:1313 length:120 start_codon:yes stop_codon:yes gene_type:complete
LGDFTPNVEADAEIVTVENFNPNQTEEAPTLEDFNATIE